jgi:hypothetical protein
LSQYNRTVSGNIHLREGYRRRPVKPLGVWSDRGWVLKVYGIAHSGAEPEPRGEVVAAARETAQTILRHPGQTDGCYGLGFAVVHEGQDACWLLVDWWLDECMIEQRLFTAPREGFPRFTPVTRLLTSTAS